MRLSHLFFATLRDDPAEAEMASHRLLVRAGYVRQLGAGIYSLLPLGFHGMGGRELFGSEFAVAIEDGDVGALMDWIERFVAGRA